MVPPAKLASSQAPLQHHDLCEMNVHATQPIAFRSARIHNGCNRTERAFPRHH